MEIATIREHAPRELATFLEKQAAIHEEWVRDGVCALLFSSDCPSIIVDNNIIFYAMTCITTIPWVPSKSAYSPQAPPQALFHVSSMGLSQRFIIDGPDGK